MTCEQQASTISPVKRGDSFLLACTYKQNGVATDITSYVIRSQVRDSADNLVQEMNVSKADQTANPGVFVLSGGSTANWPIDLLRCDIQFSEGSTVRSTQTFYIPIEEDVTHD